MVCDKTTDRQLMLPSKEDLHTEFKTSFNEEVIVTLVAFANAKGGKVYVGVNDEGMAVGVDLSPESVQNWINEIKQKTEPSIIPDVDVEDVDGRRDCRFNLAIAQCVVGFVSACRFVACITFSG